MASTPTNRTAPALTDDRLTLVGLLLEVQRGLAKAMDEVHAAHGLLGKEFDALLRLARSDQHRLSMRDLAAQTSTSTSGTTGLVDRLEARGLVTRSQSQADRRSFDIILTDAGHRLVAEDATALMPVIDRLVTDPVGPDAEVVQHALERIRDLTTPQATAGRRS
ncbi:MarR family winged helix-turn-helix transcriptional regulator [Arthrobacter sp. 179]|uniref:MarR family winged helix-turn-helix transcriptional regulator n=1 Tax=Arthrobacter sp. 179 TaxID=3457734 RepID=UPI0040337717